MNITELAVKKPLGSAALKIPVPVCGIFMKTRRARSDSVTPLFEYKPKIRQKHIKIHGLHVFLWYGQIVFSYKDHAMYPMRYRANDAAMRLEDKDFETGEWEFPQGKWDWFYMPKGIRNLWHEYKKKRLAGAYEKSHPES